MQNTHTAFKKFVLNSQQQQQQQKQKQRRSTSFSIIVEINIFIIYISFNSNLLLTFYNLLLTVSIKKKKYRKLERTSNMFNHATCCLTTDSHLTSQLNTLSIYWDLNNSFSLYCYLDFFSSISWSIFFGQFPNVQSITIAQTVMLFYLLWIFMW